MNFFSPNLVETGLIGVSLPKTGTYKVFFIFFQNNIKNWYLLPFIATGL